MRRAAVPIVAAMLLAGLSGCGAAMNRTAKTSSSLCIDAGLPLSGSHAAAARGVLEGLRMQIPAAGLSVGGYRIHLCRAFDDGAGVQAVVASARQAAENVHTIAYVGELSGDRAGLADAVLAQAGIALVTPSGPPPAPVSATTPGAPPAASPLRSTVFYLLPSAKTQSDAVALIRSIRGCDRVRRGRRACAVFSPAAAPLCSGIAPASSLEPRLCVLAGPDLSSGWPSPAVAYGDSAGQLLVSSLRAVTAAGEDVADRDTVLTQLSKVNLGSSPIGPIRFDSGGGMEADEFSPYTVKADGGLVLSSGTFRTH